MAKRTTSRSSRPCIIAGNWKMYKTIAEAVEFVETLAPHLQSSQAQAYIAVPFTAIHATSKLVKQNKIPLFIGAQNMNDASEGAFTGEIAARMLTEVGADFVILGHSERRHIFHEQNDFINRKVKRAFADQLKPILCVGETLEERRQGKMQEVLKNQLLKGLEGIESDQMKTLLLAYEPVWAIGTGEVASPDEAQEAHLYCRELLAKEWGKRVAQKVPILYGGSVKPANAASLLKQADVDGLLVGGASLSAQTFSEIIHSYQGET